MIISQKKFFIKRATSQYTINDVMNQFHIFIIKLLYLLSFNQELFFITIIRQTFFMNSLLIKLYLVAKVLTNIVFIILFFDIYYYIVKKPKKRNFFI